MRRGRRLCCASEARRGVIRGTSGASSRPRQEGAKSNPSMSEWDARFPAWVRPGRRLMGRLNTRFGQTLAMAAREAGNDVGR